MPVCPVASSNASGAVSSWSEPIGAGSAAGSRPTPFLQSTRFAGPFRAGLHPAGPKYFLPFLKILRMQEK
jgi:hypothetical protein